MPSRGKFSIHVLDAASRRVEWHRQYILFHGKRHLLEMGTAEIEQFLAHLALTQRLPVAWQREARLDTR